MFYRIHDHTEEFTCPTCGAPCYVGERAYQDGEGGVCYCSVACCIGPPSTTQPDLFRPMCGRNVAAQHNLPGID